MKKIVIILVLMTFYVPLYAVDLPIISKLESSLKEKFDIYPESKENTSKLYKAQWGDIEITCFEKFYKDSDSDYSDYFSSSQMYVLYNDLKDGKEFKNLFNVATIIEKVNDVILVDYLVISMYELSDFRLDRYFIIFNKEKSIIIETWNKGNIQNLKTKVSESGYMKINRSNSVEWESHLKVEDFAGLIRNGTVTIEAINNWYNKTEEIKKVITRNLTTASTL